MLQENVRLLRNKLVHLSLNEFSPFVLSLFCFECFESLLAGLLPFGLFFASCGNFM